jgi:hypothetical protein
MPFDEFDPYATSPPIVVPMIRQRAAVDSAVATHSAIVYYRDPTSQWRTRNPTRLSLVDGRLRLTDLDGNSELMSSPTGDVRAVIIDHARLHVRLRNGTKVAVSLYPMGLSRKTGPSTRFLYVSTFVNGWANIRDQRVATWKQALRANGIKVRDRNRQLIPPITLALGAFVFLLVLAAVIQIVDVL